MNYASIVKPVDNVHFVLTVSSIGISGSYIELKVFKWYL